MTRFCWFLRLMFQLGVVRRPRDWAWAWGFAGRVARVERERGARERGAAMDPITRLWDTPEEDEAWRDL